MNYRHTHQSVEDQSPAMLLFQNGDFIVLMNEDGYPWSDTAKDWEPIP